MKILYIKQKGEDYLGDSIYHGLKSTYGKDVSCINDLDYMYSNYPNKSQLYGKGFSLFCTLDPKIQVIDNKVELNIRGGYYDYIFYGSIWRCTDYLDLVMENYPKEKIIIFDGEDATALHPLATQGFNYFKRELERKIDEKLYPISFSIPEEKFVKDLTQLNKIKDFATVVPYKTETYVFDKEEDYRKDYQESYFGVTMKKAGWDCMRHYEILANGCVPYFPDIDNCPFYTLYNFPKKLVRKANELTLAWDELAYNELLVDIFEYSKNNFTTKAIIQYIFEKIQKKIKNNKWKENHPIIDSEYQRLCSPEEGQSVDIKEHLPTLYKYGIQCNHITEMGVRSVVSTWAFLSSLPQKLISYDIEYHPNIEKALVAAKEAGIQFDYILKDVLKTEIEETDFLFLDTWHTYQQVKGELEKHNSKVRKYIGFHDTTSYEWDGEGAGQKGIWPAIQEFLDEHPEWEIAERFYNNNGLTILKRK